MAAQTPSKTMSSRLLTMKFMQRAAASSSPTSKTSTTIADQPSPKRRKVSHKDSMKSEVDSLVDREAIQAAIDEGERKREEALVRNAAELGDARWVLEVPNNTSITVPQPGTPLQVVEVGFAQIDYPDSLEDKNGAAEDSSSTIHPIRRYNMGRNKGASQANDSDDDSSSNDSKSSNASSSTGEDDSDMEGHGKRQVTTTTGLSSKKSVEKTKAKQFAEKRRKKEIKLNQSKSRSPGGMPSKLLSLSSGGRPMAQKSGSFSFNCHNCGETGHKAADCKRPKRKNR